MNQHEFSFIRKYCWECTHEPFTGTATDQLHALGLGYRDLSPLFAPLHLGMEFGEAPADVGIPWNSKDEFHRSAELLMQTQATPQRGELKPLLTCYSAADDASQELYEGRKLIFPGLRGLQGKWMRSCFPQHTTFVHADFSGGAEVFVKKSSTVEVLNCLDAGLYDFFHLILDRPMDLLIRVCQLDPLESQRDTLLNSTSSVDQALLHLLKHDRLFECFFAETPDNDNRLLLLEALAYRLRKVRLTQQSLDSLIEQYDGEQTLWFYEGELLPALNQKWASCTGKVIVCPHDTTCLSDFPEGWRRTSSPIKITDSTAEFSLLLNWN